MNDFHRTMLREIGLVNQKSIHTFHHILNFVCYWLAVKGGYKYDNIYIKIL